jgi:5'-nucleotidase
VGFFIAKHVKSVYLYIIMQILLKELLKEVQTGQGEEPLPIASPSEPTEKIQKSSQKNIQCYVDMDGVLVDMDKGFAAHPLTGGYIVKNFKNHPKFKGNGKLATSTFWKIINNTPHFWLKLPEMPDAKKLWEFLIDNFPETPPVILSAGQVDKTDPKFNIQTQKEEWIRQHISSTAQVILADAGRNKSRYAINRGDPNIIHLLIDDTEISGDPNHQNCTNWEKAGANFKALHYIGLADARVKLTEFMVANGHEKPNISQ